MKAAAAAVALKLPKMRLIFHCARESLPVLLYLLHHFLMKKTTTAPLPKHRYFVVVVSQQKHRFSPVRRCPKEEDKEERLTLLAAEMKFAPFTAKGGKMLEGKKHVYSARLFILFSCVQFSPNFYRTLFHPFASTTTYQGTSLANIGEENSCVCVWEVCEKSYWA